MAGSVLSVTAFGYVVPLTVVLVFVALVIGLLLAVLFYFTISYSVYRSVKKTRRDRVRPDLRTELLDRLFAEDPEWEQWVGDLTAVEREVAESLLDEHLRELDGVEAESLRGLGDALGIPERSGRQLETGGEYTRLQALTWLTLLRRPGPYADSSFEPQTPRERASVVTLLEKTDQLPDTETGISVLLDGTDEQFTVFGQDTLYRVARRDPAPLLRKASEAYDEWPEPLLGQVLAVCSHLETSVSDGELAWLVTVLETGNEATRAAAADALGSFGWQTSLRETAFLERAIRDPSPRVRRAVYEMLASWGDRKALDVLREALSDEEDPRALTAGTTALINRRDRLEAEPEIGLEDTWAWSLEHVEYDRLARGSHRRVQS
jgi:hypothetical protein